MSENKKVKFLIYRGKESGELKEYELEIAPGMVVLDAILEIQTKFANDLAIRCNCKAGKCGSCSAEINGKPQLMCKTRIMDLAINRPIVVMPMRGFPIIKDLVTDVSFNYEVAKKIPFLKKDKDSKLMYQYEVERVQELRKCIECFLCQNTCHILRNHEKKDDYFGPRYLLRVANLEMHPLDREERISFLKKTGLELCNVTKCCTQVCPEQIRITDNAIIPLKEKLVDRYYDPIRILFHKLFRRE